MANYYPPVSFHFRVDIDGLTTGDRDINFQEVSGLNASVGEYTYNEGGENRFVHRLPDRVTYEKLILKRGMLVGSSLIGWFRDAVESFDFDPKDIVVTLLNADHEPLEAWNIVKAYPVKWSISGFNAQGNEIVAETIELAFQYFVRMEVNK
ncbi:phage tail protein [Marinigracilibium pacificum]|uniref:Phage tail protein n=1 Tax=Marinigracilibium pacificum TaxID=2729599 RepID=A0A848J589_9BACT|nr:phage tail protein [Marinigracilibium pacificum]NMM49680.1 phage tail protein [Marinigracilibium pacificum]